MVTVRYQGKLFTPELRAAALDAVRGGERVIDVAARFDIAEVTLRDWMRKAGVRIGPAKTVRRSTAEERAAAVERYIAGESANDIARSLGCSDITVHAWLKRAGVPRRKIRSTPEIRAEAVRLYLEEHLTTREIGERLGFERDPVSKWLKEADVSGLVENARRSEAVSLYAAGVPLKEIERRIGLHYQTIHVWVDRSGVSRRKPRATDAQKQRAIVLYKRGMSSADVGAEVGMSERSVLRALHAAGVPVRSPGGPGSRFVRG